MILPSTQEISDAAKSLREAPEEETTTILKRAWASHNLFNEADRIAKWLEGQQPPDATAGILSAIAHGLSIGLRISEARAGRTPAAHPQSRAASALAANNTGGV